MAIALVCQPAADSVPVEPCGTIDGVAMVPVPVNLGGGPLDYDQVGPLFSYGVTVVVAAFLVGLVVGSIIKLIRSA